MNINDFAFWGIQEYNLAELDMSQRDLGTLSVHKDNDALAVATFVEISGKELITTVDDYNEIVGVIVPKKLLGRINLNMGKNYKSLPEALADIANDPEEIARHFHHETNNYLKIELNWCDRHKHLTADNPCQRQP